MQQWEYISVLGKSDTVFNDAGEEVVVQTYLAQMGQLGWELVAVTPHPGDSPDDPCFFYRLKRRREQTETIKPQAEPIPHKVQRPVLPSLGEEDGGDLEGAFAFGFGSSGNG
jgi:hypothetical protein